MVAAIVTGVLAVSAGVWWFTRPPPPEVAHDPVSVVIADFENRTGEPTFDRTLEPMLRRALEGAAFITAFDRNGIRRTVGVALPEKLDEAAARDLAVKQGLGVVLAGAIDKQGSGYRVSMKATQTVTGKVVSDVSARASGQDQVIATATKLVSTVRTALGDPTSESDQIFAMTSLSAASIDVVRHYAAAMEFQSNNKFEDARQSLLKAVALDPKFGVGYLALAGASRNMGLMQDAQKYSQGSAGPHRRHDRPRALHDARHVLPADPRLPAMREGARRPHRAICGGRRRAQSARPVRVEAAEPDPRPRRDARGRGHASQARDLSRQPVHLLELCRRLRDRRERGANGSGDRGEGCLRAGSRSRSRRWDRASRRRLSRRTRRLAALPGLGPTLSASGLGDASAYEGRFNEAVRLLEQGAAADLAAKSPDRAAAKLAALAFTQLSRGQKAAAVAAVEKALTHSTEVPIRFLAARTFVEAGQPAKAIPLMTGLAAELQPEPQAYGKIIEALIAMNGKDQRPAIKLLTDANALLDTWIGHFELGRAYLGTGQLPQADSEFDRCLKRRGEAISLFLDEEPTFAYFPMVYYYQGRVREAMKLAGAADSYRAYLAIREKAGEDPLLADIRKRIK